MSVGGPDLRFIANAADSDSLAETAGEVRGQLTAPTMSSLFPVVRRTCTFHVCEAIGL